MKTLLQISILAIVLTCQAQSTTNSTDYKQIEEISSSYFEGWENKDAKLLNDIFHESARVQYLEKGAYNEVAIEQHIDDITKPEAKFLPEHRRIVRSIVVGPGGATSIVSLVFKNFEVMDVFQLLKIDGEWRIVNKLSVSGSLP